MSLSGIIGNCGFNNPKLSEVWLADFTDLRGNIGMNSQNKITSITPTIEWNKVRFFEGQLTEDLQRGNNRGFYGQSLEIDVLAPDQDTRYKTHQLLNGRKLALAKDFNGNYWLLGEDGGMRFTNRDRNNEGGYKVKLDARAMRPAKLVDSSIITQLNNLFVDCDNGRFEAASSGWDVTITGLYPTTLNRSSTQVYADTYSGELDIQAGNITGDEIITTDTAVTLETNTDYVLSWAFWNNSNFGHNDETSEVYWRCTNAFLTNTKVQTIQAGTFEDQWKMYQMEFNSASQTSTAFELYCENNLNSTGSSTILGYMDKVRLHKKDLL